MKYLVALGLVSCIGSNVSFSSTSSQIYAEISVPTIAKASISAAPDENTIQYENCQLNLANQEVLESPMNGVWLWQMESQPETFFILSIVRLADYDSFFVTQQFSHSAWPKFNFCRKALLTSEGGFPSISLYAQSGSPVVSGVSGCDSNISLLLTEEMGLKGSISVCSNFSGSTRISSPATFTKVADL